MTRPFASSVRIVALVLVAVVCLPSIAPAQTDVSLSKRQASVAERYKKLEELLLRLADVESVENPERSALLRRAAKQSRDQFILNKLKTASDSLETQEFQKAVENQEAAEKDLQLILKLLLSEDRSKRIRDEKERFQRLIKDLKRNLNNQRSARARTENGADLDDVQREQKSVTKRSQDLKDRLAKDNGGDESESGQSGDSKEQDSSQKPGEENIDGDETRDPDSDPKDDSESESDSQGSDSEKQGNDSEPSDSQSPSSPKEGEQDSDQEAQKPGQQQDQQQQDQQQQGQQQQGQQQQGQQQQGQQQQGQQQQGQQQQGQQQQGQQQQGQQQQGQQQQGQQQQQQGPKTPEEEVEQQLKDAIERMEQAEKELERSKRDEATEQQRKAEENLRAAIDRLERILRQLREEELQRELARLESRLRKMAAMQTNVLDDTVALSATPKSQRSRQTDLKAGDLAFEEKKITLEADRALLLLREEGSSVAFPEVVSQIRTDTTRVSDLLGQTKIDAISQGIQQDILAALEEMIGALQKAQRDLEKRKQQQQQQGGPPSSGQQEQPLVQALAELKLIRTMEIRIKSTTDRYSALLESGDATPIEMLPLLQDLSDRQDRIDRITRDLVSKRNQ